MFGFGKKKKKAVKRVSVWDFSNIGEKFMYMGIPMTTVRHGYYDSGMSLAHKLTANYVDRNNEIKVACFMTRDLPLLEKQQEEWPLFMEMQPRIFLDGDRWCCLLGRDLQDGIVGFGGTPSEAVREWDTAMNMPASALDLTSQNARRAHRDSSISEDVITTTEDIERHLGSKKK